MEEKEKWKNNIKILVQKLKEYNFKISFDTKFVYGINYLQSYSLNLNSSQKKILSIKISKMY